MGNNGLPDGVTQSDYEAYVKDMEGQEPYDPDEATIDDMEREHITGKEVLEKQMRVFNAKYLDEMLARDRERDDMASSVFEIASESGALDNNGATYGNRAQAGISYYVLRRMDDIHADVANGKDDNYGRAAFWNLYEYCNVIDNKLSCEDSRCLRTGVLNEGVSMLLHQNISWMHGKDGFDEVMEGTSFPSDMQQLYDMGNMDKRFNMSDYLSLIMKDGRAINDYDRAVLCDNFLRQLPFVKNEEKWRDSLFEEIAGAYDVVVSSNAAEHGIVIERDEPEEVTRALFGYTISGCLDEMGFHEYMKEHAAGLSHEGVQHDERSIKNVPDFKSGNENERSDEYES